MEGSSPLLKPLCALNITRKSLSVWPNCRNQLPFHIDLPPVAFCPMTLSWCRKLRGCSCIKLFYPKRGQNVCRGPRGDHRADVFALCSLAVPPRGIKYLQPIRVRAELSVDYDIKQLTDAARHYRLSLNIVNTESSDLLTLQFWMDCNQVCNKYSNIFYTYIFP